MVYLTDVVFFLGGVCAVHKCASGCETPAQRKRKGTGNLKRKHYIALCGERVLKCAVDVSEGYVMAIPRNACR